MALEYLLLLLSIAIVVGQNAKPCTQDGRYCYKQASCVQNKCVCNNNTVGSGLLECVSPHEQLCQVRADPHIVTFGQARGNLELPCRYRLSRFATPVQNKSNPTAFCSFEVFGFNFLSDKGKYFAAGVEISIAVSDSLNQVFKQADVVKFEISSNGFSSNMGGDVEWGTGAHADFQGVSIYCTFDMEDQFAILNVPACNTRIKFRPYNASDEPGPQTRMPGITIMTGQDSLFKMGTKDKFPESLCGGPSRSDDNESLYTNQMKALELRSTNEVLLFAVLNQSLPQVIISNQLTSKLLPFATDCEAAIRAFKTCSISRKNEAIRSCSPILSKAPVMQCLGTSVVRFFQFCLEVKCGLTSRCGDMLSYSSNCPVAYQIYNVVCTF